MTTIEQTSWIGKRLEGHSIEAQIGEGAFSWVYRSSREDTAEERAIKVAKPAELVGTPGGDWPYQTKALAFITGGTTTVHPDASQLLGIQTTKLKDCTDPALVSIHSAGFADETYYCQMELLEGKTLRELMSQGPVAVPMLLQLVEAVERLCKDTDFQYHGDLKPDNIMVTAEGIKLIDPGHFGPLDCKEGNLARCLITTPAYYPLLSPDDLFALGIILWEVACKKHPLGGSDVPTMVDRKNFGDALVRWVRSKELVGQYFLTPILEAGRPSQRRADLNPALEPLLLKAMRLKLTPDGKLDRDKGFESFSDMASALHDLLTSGVTDF